MALPNPMDSRSAARLLVEGIADDHGYLEEAFYEGMDLKRRRRIQRVLLAKDKMIGASVMLLAKELYSKDVRFIFELLQNADDNHYSNAEAEPYVAFHLRQRTFIIECNEDGFNETNLRAICSIGDSSKVQGHGYTGEKGIGFKSVFKVAWKAHIQSGDFSFAFVHRPGDSGMGMISPEWEEHSGQPTRNLTRITLHLLEDDQAAARHELITQQLNDLESNMLLFLKKIKRINIHVYNELDEKTSHTTLKVSLNQLTNRAVLEKHRTQNGMSKQTQTYCHVTKHQASNLPKSDNRNYTAAEEAAKSYSKAEVILAFPLSENSAPIVEAQQVFAFLPLRRLGFNFLIQTDFVTMANREDVVTSSSRNLALLDGIADAFIKAIRQMYSHNTLRYQWMRYLSNMKTYSWDEFWRRLVEKIENRVRAAEVLQPRRHGSPRLIQDLRRLRHAHCAVDGSPLFEDLPGTSESYISTMYQGADLFILSYYGLDYMAQNGFIKRLEHDLQQPHSRMKDPTTSQGWHSRAAMQINVSFLKDWRGRIAETRALCLLPLADGRWVSAANQVFFPTINDGIIVPDDIGLSTLAIDACENESRATLFTNLGIKRADVDDVRSRILALYAGSHGRYTIDLETSHAHLVFLYRTHKIEHQHQYSRIKMYDTENRFGRPGPADYHFTSHEPDSLWQLSRQGRNQWFRTNVSFINPRYFENPPEDSENLSWKAWLSMLGIRDHPRLVGRDGISLSPLCLHVAESMPSKFMDFIRCAWKSEQQSVLSSQAVVGALKTVKVLCHDDGELRPLSRTYLPLPSLQELCSDFMQEDFFPFLDLGDSWSSDEQGKWSFLAKHLGVGADDGLQFYIDMLDWIRAASCHDQVEDPLRVLNIYVRIQSRCVESRAPFQAKNFVKSKIGHGLLVYLPQYDDEEGSWCLAENCLINAPLDMQYKDSIDARYEAAFPGHDMSPLKRFFVDTLEIQECSWTDIVWDLESLKDDDKSDFDQIRSRYERLDTLRRSWVTVDINTRTIREQFGADSLIFVQKDQGQYRWVKPSDCLWSSATEIRHKVMLNSYYDDDLEDFFVTVLGVSRLTIDMVYDELCAVDPASTTVKQVKDYLWSMNAFLETDAPARSSEALLEKRIFPVRYPAGDVLLVAVKVQFAIVDRQRLNLLFQDKIKLLDFTLKEVHELRPLLSWMNLTARLLSKLTKSNTVVSPEMVYPLADSMRHIRKKAHALTRVAAYLNSPRTRSTDLAKDLHALLLSAETWETNEISSTLTIHQDDRPVSVELERAEVHITTSESPLKIYVPHDEVMQDVCFGSALPEHLVRWLVTDPVTQQIVGKMDESAIKIVTGVLAAKSAAAMSRILDLQGVAEIAIPNLTLEEDDQPDDTAAEPEAGHAQVQRPHSPERLASPSTPTSTSSDDDRYYGSADDEEAGFPQRHSSNVYQHSRQPDVVRVQHSPRNNEYYRTLLRHVVACARETSLPRRGTDSVSTHADRHLTQLPSGSEWLLRCCASLFERDCMIGAAGELFAFELLGSWLGDVGRPCWQSTVRRLVTGHPDYADMDPWNSSGAFETSDIVYEDSNSRFTDILVAGQYLNASTWAGRQRVRYYIEVKSTFGDCNGPFYVSDRQRRLMNELMTDRSVYMILRVFSMTSGSIGARIYVDPGKMERDGLLKFSTEKWTVTPEAGLFS